MATPIRLLLVDDHRMLRDGLRSLFEGHPAVRVVGEADGGLEALERIPELRPDVVVVDVGMADMNGIELTRQIRLLHPAVRVLALSTYSDKRYVLNMLEAGASGYVVKSAASEELVRGVEAVAEGRSYLSPDITDVVVGTCLGGRGSARSAYTVLGAREREVLQLLAEGRTSPQIAERLHIAVKTVETHRRNITRKVGLHSVAQLTKYAVREGLTSLDG